MKNPDMQWDFPVITAHLDESGNGGWQSIRTARYHRYIKYLKTGAEELMIIRMIRTNGQT